MAYNGKGVDTNDIARTKAKNAEAINIATKAAGSTRKMFGGSSTRVAGDSKSISNKIAIMKEQQIQYRAVSRMDSTDNNLDPYGFPSPAKLKAVDKLALREQGYTNTLLTQIIKNQSNPEGLRAEAQYRDNVLSLLKEIRDNTTKERKKTDLTNGKTFESKSRKLSTLAEAILGGSPKDILAQLFKSTNVGGAGLEGLGMVKDVITSFKEPGVLKQTMLDALIKGVINTMPTKGAREHLTRFRADASTYIQDIINQLAFGKNSALRSITQAHHQAVGYSPEKSGRTDMSKEALFDNKFYTAVTLEIPSILYSIRDGINKYVGERYDYDKQEWTSLQEQIKEMAQSSQTITTGVDQMMRTFSLMSEKAVAGTGGIANSNMSQLFDTDKFGSFTKDKNGRLKFQNELLVRQVMSALLKAKVDSNSFLSVEPNTLIEKLGLKSRISKEYHAILPNIILGLSDVFNHVDWEERKAFDNRREDIINATERSYMSNKSKLSTYSPEYVSAMYKFEKGIINARQFEEMTGASISRAGAWGGKGGGGGNSGGGGSGSRKRKKSKVNNKVKQQSSIRSTKDLYDLLKSPTVSVEALTNMPESVWNELPEDTKREVNNLVARATFSMTSTKVIDNLISNDLASDIRGMSAAQKEEALRTQKAQAIKSIVNNGGITDKGLRDRYYSDSLTEEDQAKLDKELKKYFKANEYFAKMNNANMTAASMANYVGMGTKASDMERLGFIKDPAQLIPFIDENGNLDINKLKTKYSKYNEAMMKGIERRDRIAREGMGFEVTTPIDSFNKILTNIFTDPKITRITGVVGGAGVGLAVGKLLQSKGIVQSPLLGQLLAGVMGGAMMFSRTREKMEAVLGAEGEFKNQDGITNRQIFMAKFINKWLPSIGLGGKVGSMTMKAFQAMGPIGALMSPFMGLTTGLIAGAMAPSLLRFAQRKLFDDDGKGNKGIFKKIGNFLKGFDFIKKYFNIKDKRTDKEVRHDVLSEMIKNLQADNDRLLALQDNPEASEEEKTRALTKYAENEKRILELRSLDNDLTAIEEDQERTDEEKKAARERRIALLGEKNKEAYGVRESAEMKRRDLSKSGVAIHDMKFMTKEDMYKATYDNFMDTKLNEVRSNMGARGVGEKFLAGDFAGIGDKELVDKLQEFYDKMPESDKKDREKAAYMLNEYAMNTAETNFVGTVNGIKELMYDENGKIRTDFQVARIIATEYMRENLEKHNYDRAIENGKVLLPNQIVGTSLMQEFNAIMQNQNLTPEQKEAAIKDWYGKLPNEKKEALNQVVRLRMNMADSYSRAIDMYSMYLSMTKPELAKREDDLLRNSIYGIREVAVLNSFANDIGNIKNIAADSMHALLETTIGGGYIVKDARAKGQSEQVINQLMNMQYNELAGGAGGSDESDTKTGWKMTDFTDLKFKNGRPVSVAGCALGAFNAAIIRHGYPPMSASVMVDVANEFLSNDGVNLNFFKAMAAKIEWECKQYKGSENTFTPQNIKPMFSDPKSSAILQLKNVDNDGSHYVTMLSYNPKKCQVCDPQSNSYKTTILTGDILARLISVTVITKPGSATLVEDSDKSIKAKAKKLKQSMKEGLKNGLKSTMLGSLIFGGYQLGKMAYRKYKGLPATDTKGGTATGDGKDDTKYEDPIVAKLQEILNKLKDIINVRIVEDYTIPLTNTDLESSRSALMVNQQSAKDPRSKGIINKIRNLFNRPSFQKDQLKKEAVEDAILANANGNTQTLLPVQQATEAAAEKTESWWQKLLNLFPGLLTGIGGKILGFLGSMATTIGGYISSGFSTVLGWIQTGLAGALGQAVIAGLQVLGIFTAIVAAAQGLRWIAEKYFGLKPENVDAMGRGNDLGTSEYVDTDGRTFKEGSKAYFNSAKKGYIFTDEWYEFAKKRVAKGNTDHDTSYYTNKSEMMESFMNYGNIDTDSKWMGKEFDIAYIEAERAKMQKEAEDKWLKDNPEGNRDGTYKSPFKDWKLREMGLEPSQPGDKPANWNRLKMGLDAGNNFEAGDGPDERGSKTVPSRGYRRYNFAKLLVSKAAKFKYGTYDMANKMLGFATGAMTKVMPGGKFGINMGQGTGLQGDFSNITRGDANPISIISRVSQITGVDENLMMAIAGKESGFKADAGATGSSAKGLFQFTSATWKEVTKKHANKIGLTAAEMQHGMGTPNDPRFNPYMNAFMGAFHLIDEYNIAKKYAGRDPLPEEVYMVHAFGIGGAKKYIQASKDAIGIQLETSQNVINSNPYFFYEGGKKRIRPFTVGEMYSWFRKGLESGLSIRNKKSGTSISFASAFGAKVAGDEIFEPSRIAPDVKMGESIGKTYAGIMNNMPIKGTRKDVVVTSAFGPRNVRGGSKNHKGIDIRAYKGTPIYATHGGRITRNEPNFGMIEITGDNGMATRYLHLSRRTPLKVGEFVKPGSQIGEAGGVGPNGRVDAYGSHLHYEVIDAAGNKLDPFKVLELTYDNLKHSERENMQYAKRNGLIGRGVGDALAKANLTPISELGKGDGPVNHDSAPTKIVMGSGNEGLSVKLLSGMMELLSKLIASQNQTTEAVNNLTKTLQAESRNNSLMSNAKLIAKSRI